jgi:hypothetical protein
MTTAAPEDSDRLILAVCRMAAAVDIAEGTWLEQEQHCAELQLATPHPQYQSLQPHLCCMG